jgi:hypothetical protein
MGEEMLFVLNAVCCAIDTRRCWRSSLLMFIDYFGSMAECEGAYYNSIFGNNKSDA